MSRKVSRNSPSNTTFGTSALVKPAEIQLELHPAAICQLFDLNERIAARLAQQAAASEAAA